METNLVAEFIKSTGAKRDDAISCLQSWSWDLKKALIDYNDTSTTNYLRNRSNKSNNNSGDNSASTSDSESSNNNNKIHRKVQSKSPLSVSHHCNNNNNINSNNRSSRHLVPSSNNANYSMTSGGSKPVLVKSDSVDLVDYKKLARGISRANDNIVSRARSEFAMDFHFHTKQQPTYLIDTPDYTFTLPDLSHYAEDFRKFLEKDLIECSTLNSLENAGRLNWWVDMMICRKLWPLATTGDGNCLLHAASLAMWGFHDRRLTLRKALHAILSEGDYRNALLRRWRFQQTRLNKEAGLVFSELEWEREWEEIVAIASPEPRHPKHNSSGGSTRRRSVIVEKSNSSISCNDSIDGNAVYESLEEIHVLALAYVLRRAIIVISDVVLRDINGEALAPIPFGGVYLPYDIEDCHKVPLLLAYDMAHFSALVTMESQCDFPAALIPLIDSENILLPLQFCIDPGEGFNWSEYDGREGNWALSDVEHIALLKEYLNIVYASPAGSPDDELYDNETDEEYEKKLSEMTITTKSEDSQQLVPTPQQQQQQKSKLQTVAKQFGSIGKSMSKKIKKNIGSITKLGGNKANSTSHTQLSAKSSNSSNSNSNSMTPTLAGGMANGKLRLLCAQLKAKRHEYQEEMIRNYLDCAKERFLEMQQKKVREDDNETYANCINAGCVHFGTAKTSYMCLECYEQQKKHEITDYASQPPRYGTGNSKFYTQSDMKTHDSIKRLPSVKRLNELDQTIYLSNSTFYNDTKPGNLNHLQAPKLSSGDESDMINHSANSNQQENGFLLRKNSSNSSLNSSVLKNGLLNSRCVVALPPAPQSPSPLVQTSQQKLTLKNGTFSFPTDDCNSTIVKCRTHSCPYYGTNTSFYCSKCYQEQQQSRQHYRKLQTDI